MEIVAGYDTSFDGDFTHHVGQSFPIVRCNYGACGASAIQSLNVQLSIINICPFDFWLIVVLKRICTAKWVYNANKFGLHGSCNSG